MSIEALDNPFWSSLTTVHRDIALGERDVLRYPAAFAPFLGVPHPDVDIDEALDALIPPGDTALMLGVVPARLSSWRLEPLGDIAQMVRTSPLPMNDGPEVVQLQTDAHRADALALTALVYPHYFRARTMELGRYFGIYVDGRLASMIGERFGTQHHREMSAICTHPDFVGRGYARRLTAWLTNDTLSRGLLPFLHVAHTNTHARKLYEDTGWQLRRDLTFWKLVKV